MSSASLKVFISYRQTDELSFVERLRTHAAFRYGSQNVFMDLNIIPQSGFIRQKVSDSDAVIAVIGHRWRALWNSASQPDEVRSALEFAAVEDKPIFAVSILDAPLPDTNGLTPALQQVFSRSAFPLRDIPTFTEQVTRFFEKIELQLTGCAQPMTNTKIRDVDAVLASCAHLMEAERLHEALYWFTVLRDSGQSVPPFYALDQRIADLETRVREQDTAMQRRDAAEYLYKFVRHMVRAHDPALQIRAALNEVWAIEPGYDPDGIAAAP